MRNRTWLDTPKSNADSYVVVDVDRYGILLKIADCDRNVKLEFDHGPNYGRTKAQALAKVNRLRAALDEIEQAIHDSKRE